MFDITNRKSFLEIENVIETFLKFCPENARNNLVIVGNKSDLIEDRAVTQTEAMELANKLNSTYYESSALDSTHIDDIFYKCALTALEISRY